MNIVSGPGSFGSSGRPCLLWILVPGPCYALRLLSFRLVFGTTPIPSRVQSAVAPTCTPATGKQLWSGITSLAQLKEKERLAEEAFSPFCLLSQRVQPGGIGTMDKLFFFFHNDKDTLPPAPCEFVTGRDVKHNREKSYRQAGVLKENFIPWDEYVTGGGFTAHSCTRGSRDAEALCVYQEGRSTAVAGFANFSRG